MASEKNGQAFPLIIPEYRYDVPASDVMHDVWGEMYDLVCLETQEKRDTYRLMSDFKVQER